MKGELLGNIIILVADKWIRKPPGYAMLNLRLSWNKVSNELNGIICNKGIILTRSQNISHLQSAFKVNRDNPEQIVEPEKQEKRKSVFFSGSFGVQNYNWSPGTSEDEFVSFKTEGLRSFSLISDIGFGDRRLLHIAYDGLFNYSASQKDILQSYKTGRHKGLERIKMALSLAPVSYSIFSGNSLASRLIRDMLSFRLESNRSLYYGNMYGQNDFYYVPISYTGQIGVLTEEIPLIKQDEGLAFKTLFWLNELIIPILRVEPFIDRGRYYFTMGLYNSKFTRPGRYFRFITANNDVIYMEHEFASKGFSFGIESIERMQSGLNFEWKAYAATQKNITAWNTILNEYYKNEYGFASGNMVFHFWYNYYFPNSLSNLTLGVNLQMPSWTIYDKATDKSFDFETDNNTFLYLKYRYTFQTGMRSSSASAINDQRQPPPTYLNEGINFFGYDSYHGFMGPNFSYKGLSIGLIDFYKCENEHKTMGFLRAGIRAGGGISNHIDFGLFGNFSSLQYYKNVENPGQDDDPFETIARGFFWSYGLEAALSLKIKTSNNSGSNKISDVINIPIYIRYGYYTNTIDHPEYSYKGTVKPFNKPYMSVGISMGVGEYSMFRFWKTPLSYRL